MLPLDHISPLFDATAEAVEESIINALTSAETMTGLKGRTAHALPLEELGTSNAQVRLLISFRQHVVTGRAASTEPVSLSMPVPSTQT